MLRGHGAWISQPDAQGRTPLHAASILGEERIVSTLLELGANVSETDNEGKTALHLAARDEAHLGSYLTEAILQLLQHGASATTQDDYGRTAFHSATAYHEQCSALSSHADIVRLLVNHYPREVRDSSDLLHSVAEALNIQDCHGRTALHETSRIGNRDAHNILVYAGENPWILDYSGVSAVFVTQGIEEAEPFLPGPEDDDIAARAEELLGDSEMSHPASGNDEQSNDRSHEQDGHEEYNHLAKTADIGHEVIRKGLTGWRTRWRRWKRPSVPFRASRGSEETSESRRSIHVERRIGSQARAVEAEQSPSTEHERERESESDKPPSVSKT
ncbi:ankyrin repeat-containing domain protein [Aspergillus keveii]|uniref:protein S-acyltransferase n=1 Tax=Aspergillus keveii TaxID=714993 RepID=A0ABR4FI35_9EURO